MKSLEQIKTTYQKLLSSERGDEKEIKAAQKKAGKLHKTILLLERGITEDGLKKQKADVLETIRILDSRFVVYKGCSEELQRREYMKRNGYAKLKKSLVEINWMLRL